MQAKHGVTYIGYWFDEGTGAVFCLVDAPSKRLLWRFTREALGLVTDDLTEVREGA